MLAPLMKPVLRVGEALLPRLGANSITGMVMKAYQSFYDDAFKVATDAYANGRLRVPPRMNATTAIGNRADREATRRLNQWLEREGLSSDVRVNRRLSDPNGSGAYRRPDIHIQSEKTIIDGTIGTKTMQTPQIKDLYRLLARKYNHHRSAQQAADVAVWRSLMKCGCKGKEEILDQLNYMVLYAPDFPAEDDMTLDLAFATVEHGLQQIEEKDSRSAVVDAVNRVRAELAEARKLFDEGQINPACHKLQDAEDILKPIRVKAEVA
ncbi:MULTISPECIES: hypothetical protein [Gammaproteobacteria]|uniref:hypothetical protein n=1 Tax=Gammaproteobacteria TaxID=1236 RepID=UPI0015F3D7A2|nr:MULTISPECIES: hypothetical protein [Gammaproteobacteria]